MQNTDVIILGNGLVAKTLALALSLNHVSSLRVAPHHPAYPNDPRSYAIAPSSLNLLQAVGLEFPNRTAVNRVELAFGDVLNGQTYALENAGDMFSMIDHSELNAALDEVLEDNWIDAEPGDITVEEFRVELPKIGVCAPLTIIAEGKYGQNLAQFGFTFNEYNFHQNAIATKLIAQRPHEGVARQLFQTTGPLALLPFEERGISIVWSQERARAEALLNIDEAQFVAILEETIGAYYGKLELQASRSAFPLRNVISPKLIQNRVALVGDSAHVLHPIAGQGLNLGLRDVAVMVETLRQAKRTGLDIGTRPVLEIYESGRKGDIARLNALTRGMNDLTQSTNPAVAGALDLSKLGLKLAPLRQWLAKMSDSGLEPQPPLLDGRLR